MKLIELKELVETYKKKGKRIVTTCGCFSILHPGHLECLKGAKDFGDVLIVGINSDMYILQNKKSKIIFRESERIEMLMGLRWVDHVFVFYDGDFSKALLALRPHFFIKGMDYKNCLNKNEEEVCHKFDIAIRFIGERKRYNSSEIWGMLK